LRLDAFKTAAVDEGKGIDGSGSRDDLFTAVEDRAAGQTP